MTRDIAGFDALMFWGPKWFTVTSLQKLVNALNMNNEHKMNNEVSEFPEYFILILSYLALGIAL